MVKIDHLGYEHNPISRVCKKRVTLPIFGAGHSGSTLLDVLLSCHKNIAGLGEVHRLGLNPYNRFCGCGLPLRQCEFWSTIIAHYCNYYIGDKCPTVDDVFYKAPISLPRNSAKLVGYKGSLLDVVALSGSTKLLKVLYKCQGWPAKYIDIIRNSLVLYKCIAEINGVSTVIDSTKTPLRGKILQMISPSNIFCLHLVRDGRAVCASRIRRENCDMKTAAKSWLKANRNVELSLKTIPLANYYFVRYEDLCTDPSTVINKIFKWLNLDELTNFYANLSKKTINHQIPGNTVLFSGINNIILDDKWRYELDYDALATFNSIAGKMNHKYGYID